MASRTGAPGNDARVEHEAAPRWPSATPSDRAPSLTRQVMALPGPAVRNTSSRLSATRTGIPVFRESATASALHRTVRLAAEPTADLRRDHLDAAGQYARNHCDVPALPEDALGVGPYRHVALRVDVGGVHVGLDVALMHDLRPVLTLDDDVGLGESPRSTSPRSNTTCSATLLGSDATPSGDLVKRSLSRTGAPGCIAYSTSSTGGSGSYSTSMSSSARSAASAVRRGHGGDGVPVVQRLVPRDDLLRGEVASLGCRPKGSLRTRRRQREVRARDHRHDARQGLRGGRVDAHDACMGVRAGQDSSDEQAGQLHVGPVLRAARHLFDAVHLGRTRVPMTLGVGAVVVMAHSSLRKRVHRQGGLIAPVSVWHIGASRNRAGTKTGPGGCFRGLSNAGLSNRVACAAYSSDRFWKRLRMYTANAFMESSMTSRTMMAAAASDWKSCGRLVQA